MLPPDSTVFPKQIQNHTQTDKNPTPSRWGESIAICHQHCLDSIMATLISSLMDSWLTRLCAVVRKRCTSTWSLSATSILASPPPPVSLPRPSIYASNIALTYITGHLIYKCGGIDKRTIEKFEKVRIPHRCCLAPISTLSRFFAPRWGRDSLPTISKILRPDVFGTTTSVDCCPTIHFTLTSHQLLLFNC